MWYNLVMQIQDFRLQGGNIYCESIQGPLAPIYMGANKLLKILEHKGRIYVIGENHTFLEIRPLPFIILVEYLAQVPTAIVAEYDKSIISPE